MIALIKTRQIKKCVTLAGLAAMLAVIPLSAQETAEPLEQEPDVQLPDLGEPQPPPELDESDNFSTEEQLESLSEAEMDELAEASPPAPADDVEAPIPPKLTPPEGEPEVTISRSDDGEITEEYRVNGRIYMVRITPPGGPPYFIVDTDNDGLIDTRFNELSPDVNQGGWKIFEWD